MISKIMMSLSRYAINVAKGILYCLLLSLTFSFTQASDQSLPLYFVDPDSSPKGIELEQLYRLDQLRTGDYGKPEDFNAKVRLSFKETSHPVAVESHPFVVKPIKSSKSEYSVGDTYILNGHDGEVAAPLTLIVLPKSKEIPFDLKGFNKFWLDYSPSDDMAMCMPKLEFEFLVKPRWNNPQEKWSQLTRFSQLSTTSIASRVIDYIDFSLDNWKQKDFSYILGRMFKTIPDQIWRYTQKKESAVMQRRMNVPIGDFDGLNIILAPGLSATGINIVVSSKNTFTSREVIEFFRPQNITLPDGRTSVRLNIRKALEERYQKEFSENDDARKSFHLLELNIFVPGDGSEIKKNKPVRGLELLKNALGTQDYESQSNNLKSYDQSISLDRERLAVDFSNINEQNKVKVQGIKLWLYPPVGFQSCGIRIRGLQTVEVYNKRLPVFASLVDKWAQQFGEGFNQSVTIDEQVNSPGINAYLPFSMLVSSTMRHGQIGPISQVSTSSLEQHKLPSHRVLTADGQEINPDKLHLASSGGAVLKFEGKIPEIILEHDQLLLKGSSKSIAISWPLSTMTNENTFFLLRIDEGIKHIDSVSLALELANGDLVKKHVIPNQPLKLGNRNIDIRKAKLLIALKNGPFQLKLRDLVFFSPVVTSFNQAFSVALPTTYSLSPLPKLLINKDKTLQVQQGLIVGTVNNGESVHFTTSFKPSLELVRGIKIKYKLPLVFTKKNTCGLVLNFKWTNGDFSRQLCLLKNNEYIFIPISDFLSSGDFAHNFGTLKSIDWEFNYPPDTSAALNEIFDFQFSVVGWTALSAEDRLSSFPLFYKGNSQIFGDTTHVRKISTDGYKPKIVLPLDPASVSFFLFGNNFIQAVKNPLFTIDELKLEPNKPIHMDNWRELYSPPHPYWQKWWVWSITYWQKWRVWSIILSLLAWKTARKGWWSTRKASSLGRKIRSKNYHILHSLDQALLRAAPKLNQVIGLFTLIVGGGLAISALIKPEKLEFSSVMIIATSFLITWSAFCLSKKLIVFSRLAGLISLIIGIVIGAWLYSIENTLWGYTPLLASIYAFLPSLYVAIHRFSVLARVAIHRFSVLLVLQYIGFLFWLVAFFLLLVAFGLN